MLIESVNVKNFKLLGDFSVEGLKQFTLVGGYNGCGKTTLLEAVTLCFNRKYDEKSLPIISPLREISIFDDNAFAHLSAGKEFSAPIMVLCVADGVRHGIKIMPTDDAPAKKVIGTFADAKESSDVLEIQPVKRALVDYTQKENLLSRVTVSLHKDKFESFVHPLPNATTPIGPGWFLFVRNGGLGETCPPQIDADNLSHLEKEGRVASVLKAIQLIAPQVSGLDVASVHGSPHVVVKIGETGEQMHSPLLGAGAHKMLSLALALNANENGFCLLDEITVGWHHSHLADLWRMIFRVCKERNHQVIATTHSREGIAAFAQAAQDEKAQEDACYIRLDKWDEESDPKKKVTSVTYDGKLLWSATHELEEEVR